MYRTRWHVVYGCRMEIADALSEVMSGIVENIYYKSETTLPFKAELGQETDSSKVEVQRTLLWKMV